MEKRGRIGKKVWVDTLEGWTPEWKQEKSDSDGDSYSDEQKRSPGFSGKKRGVTPSAAAPGVTHPSDAADKTLEKLV